MKDMSGVTWTYVMTLANDSGASDTLSGNIAYSMKKIQVKNLSSDVVWKPAEATDPANVVDYSIVITGTYKDAQGTDWTFTSDPIVGQEKYASTATLQIGSATPSGWTVTSSAVSEPTSGLLLLLGVAGLALRRRRA